MFQNNKVNLAISILLAIALWSYVFFEINPEKSKTISNVPVEINGVSELQERELTVANNESFTVSVTINGSRSEIAGINAGHIDASVDVSTLTEGDNDVNVVVSVPDNVTKEDVKPSSITISVEEYISASKPVKVEFSGDFEDDTEANLISWNPETTTVSGARSLVEKVAHVEAVVESSSVQDEEHTVTTKAIPVDESGEEVTKITVSDQTIDVVSSLIYLNTVPLEVPLTGSIDSSYEVKQTKVPDSVRIRGAKSQIDGIASLKAESIDISDVTETTEIPVEISLPSGVELAEESENLVVVIEIGDTEIKELSYDYSDIDLRNVESGYTALLSSGSIRVSVYGSGSALSDLSKSDIAIYIDMKEADFTHSTYTGTLEYSTKKSFREVKINPTKVKVTIAD